MTYFLDFDRTLFNTDAFKQYVVHRSGTTDLKALPEADLAATLGAMVLGGELLFAPGELAQFLYADVPEFLRAMGNEATIVTFGNPELQRIKVTSALYGIPRVSAFYTGDIRKGEYLLPRIDAYRDPILVDDAPIELELFSALHPTAKAYEMRRDGEAGDGRWSVVHSLSGLP